jgi:hypothetical protein
MGKCPANHVWLPQCTSKEVNVPTFKDGFKQSQCELQHQNIMKYQLEAWKHPYGGQYLWDNPRDEYAPSLPLVCVLALHRPRSFTVKLKQFQLSRIQDAAPKIAFSGQKWLKSMIYGRYNWYNYGILWLMGIISWIINQLATGGSHPVGDKQFLHGRDKPRWSSRQVSVIRQNDLGNMVVGKTSSNDVQLPSGYD